MKPRVVKAWACSLCSKTFNHKHGKAFAESCCTCRQCGEGPALYIGTSASLCRICRDAAKLRMVEENFERAAKAIEQIKRRK